MNSLVLEGLEPRTLLALTQSCNGAIEGYLLGASLFGVMEEAGGLAVAGAAVGTWGAESALRSGVIFVVSHALYSGIIAAFDGAMIWASAGSLWQCKGQEADVFLAGAAYGAMGEMIGIGIATSAASLYAGWAPLIEALSFSCSLYISEEGTLYQISICGPNPVMV